MPKPDGSKLCRERKMRRKQVRSLDHVRAANSIPYFPGSGVDALKDSWKAYMQMDNVRSDDRIDWETFLEISRDHIITQLIAKSGMQLKLVKRDATEEGAEITRIFCRIRAPLSLLEKKADALNHRLQFKPEVDPGYEFWQVSDKTKKEDDPSYFPEVPSPLIRFYSEYKPRANVSCFPRDRFNWNRL